MKISANEAAVIPQGVSSPSGSSTGQISQSDQSKNQLQQAARQLAQDVYHKENIQETSPTFSKPINISSNSVVSVKTVEEAIHEIAVATAHLYLPGGKVSKAVEVMFSSHEQFMAELASEKPSLLEKDWGISISQSGKLEVSGSLSDDDKAFLEAKLNSNDEFVSAAADFKSNFLRYAPMDSRGWGKYEVNNNNFGSVFDLKEMLENSRGDEEFKKYWNKDFSWLELNDNISSQLQRNADKTKL